MDSQCGDLRKAAEAARYYAAVESATLNGGPMPSPPWHLRPYSPPSEPEEEPDEGGGGRGGNGEVEGSVLAVAVGDAGGGEGGVLAVATTAEQLQVPNSSESAGGGEIGGGGEADGGEGSEAVDGVVGEANGGEGGELAAAAATEQPWAPKNTEELLNEIAEMDYGVSTDRSWSKAYPKAIEAYNKSADTYSQVVQKRGQPLREGFSIVKVCAAVAHSTNLRGGCSPLSIPAYLARSPVCISRAISRMHISAQSPEGAAAPSRLHSCTSLTTQLPHCRRLKGSLHVLHQSSTSWKRPFARTSSAWACRRRACPSCMTIRR